MPVSYFGQFNFGEGSGVAHVTDRLHPAVSFTLQLRYDLLPSADHRALRRAAQWVAQGLVCPQTGNNIGWITELGEQVPIALGLGPQGLGLTTGLMAHAGGSMSHSRTVPSPEPDTRLRPSGLNASEKT